MRSKMTLFSASKQAGVDLELTYYGVNNRFSLLTDAVKMGKVQEADLRQSVKRLFNVRMILGEFDPLRTTLGTVLDLKVRSRAPSLNFVMTQNVKFK